LKSAFGVEKEKIGWLRVRSVPGNFGGEGRGRCDISFLETRREGLQKNSKGRGGGGGGVRGGGVRKVCGAGGGSGINRSFLLSLCQLYLCTAFKGGCAFPFSGTKANPTENWDLLFFDFGSLGPAPGRREGGKGKLKIKSLYGDGKQPKTGGGAFILRWGNFVQL